MSFLGSLQEFSPARTLVVAAMVLILGGIDVYLRRKGTKTNLLLGCIAGSLLAFALIRVAQMFGGPQALQSQYAMAFAVVGLVIGWKILFAPWNPSAKVSLLGAFVFWVAFNVLAQQDPTARMVHLFSMAFALVPAVIWCLLFLKYHAERIHVVLIMFFSGMLSTVPILFYDALVRKGAEFQFFLFRVTPESFSQTSQSFVTGQLAADGMNSVLMTSLVSFVFVALIEEVSKFWVLSHSGKTMFRSIDDALELAIIVAVGFAFAENVINPVYFGGFVREYLLRGNPDIMGFFSNMLGRSVLTSMVHILSTGVAGYFLGLAVFAGPHLAEQQARGRKYPVLAYLHSVLQVREVSVFRFQMVTTGLVLAVVLHGAFNFMVTMPDLLPSHPRTVADLLGVGKGTFLSNVPLLLLPSLFYVVGGFWVLTSLFLRRENMEERGRVVETEMFVKD